MSIENVSSRLPYPFVWSKEYSHLAYADLYNNKTFVEIAVVALDNRNGDLYFIPISSLDKIDSERLLKIITKRDAHNYTLWDLMSSTTLKNGVNALSYFHQLVKVRSVSGQIFAPGTGRAGIMPANLSMRPNIQSTADVPVSTDAPQYAPQQLQEQPRKGPGRPPSVKR